MTWDEIVDEIRSLCGRVLKLADVANDRYRDEPVTVERIYRDLWCAHNALMEARRTAQRYVTEINDRRAEGG